MRYIHSFLKANGSRKFKVTSLIPNTECQENILFKTNHSFGLKANILLQTRLLYKCALK